MRINYNYIILAVLVFMSITAGTAVADEEMHMETMSGNALITNAWMHYAEWFVILTAYPAVIMMLFIALSLHVARPMVVRYLDRMTLRLGADLLWEAWIIGRDVLILSAVAFLGILILPRLQDEWFTGVLIPAFVLGAITLVYKLVNDTDADKTKYKIATILTALTLIAATIPYGVASVWHDKGHEKFEQNFFIPISEYDMQQQNMMGATSQSMMGTSTLIKDVTDAMQHAIEAKEAGDTSKAVTEVQEVDDAYHKLEGSLKAWNSAKNDEIEAFLETFSSQAKEGTSEGMKAAQQNIHEILEEFEATL